MVRVTNDAAWGEVIGEFMIAFGSIEGSINELLRQRCTDATFRFVLPLTLGQRMKLLAEVLVDFEMSKTNRAALDGNLEEVISLTKTRNLIAHNPLALHYYDKVASPTMRELIKSEHTDASITLVDLRKMATRAQKVATALSPNWIEFDMAEMQNRALRLKRA